MKAYNNYIRASRSICCAIMSCLVAVAILLTSLARAENARPASPMRAVLVYEGPNSDFYDTLFSIALELNNLGIISHTPIASATVDTKALWQWLSRHAKGTQLIFHADGFYSADWDQAKGAAVLEELRARLADRRDVDLILAFGTWAGLEMAKLNTNVPVVVCASTDAVTAGIVPSAADSGKDNLVAVVEPGRFLRQMELFHKIFAFRKLGITYTDTPSGRGCAAIDQIEAACERHGVELVRCTGDFLQNMGSRRVADQMEACHRSFVRQHVDAVIITYNSLQAWHMPQVLEPLIRTNIPTISQTGQREVQMGALVSVSQYCAKEGRFVAHLLRDLLNGVKPRSLPQLLSTPMRLSINVRTASRIGWNPPLEVLLSVDEFFQ